MGADYMNTKIRLLIIEEHKAVRQALETRLRSSPSIEVMAALHQAAAGDLNGHPALPDVALVSIRRGGDRHLFKVLELVSYLAHKGTGVIVLAPFADDIERELLLHAGASRYLLKDVNTPQLIAEIELVHAERAKVPCEDLAL
jgi:DNA-binding NarL/FixJ family response regulator